MKPPSQQQTAEMSGAPAAEFPWFYSLVWHTTRAFFGSIGRTAVAGVRHVPRTGPFLLVANHASFFDPPMLGCFLPRPVCFSPRKTLWNHRWLGWALDNLKCIPLDRDGADVAAFKKFFAALKAGDGVLIFPEGTRTRNGRMQPARRGAGLLAARAGVPVVPARVFGTYETLGRHMRWPRTGLSLGVTYGPPLDPAALDPGKSDPERYEKISEKIMAAIAALPSPWDSESA